MPDTAQVRIVVLWSHEVREAARAFDRLYKACTSEPKADPETTDALFKAAVNAGFAAFNHEDLLLDETPIVIAERQMFPTESGRKPPRVKEIEREEPR